MAAVAPVPANYGQGGGDFKFGAEQARDYSLGCFIAAGVAAFVSMMLMFLNFGFLKKDEFAELEAQETFLSLGVVSAMIIPIGLIGGCCIATESEAVKKGTAVTLAIYLAVMGLIMLVLLGAPVALAGVFTDVQNFENTEDEDVQFVLAGFLALFVNCCFDPNDVEVSAPDVNCNATGDVQPCFDDAAVFAEFDAQINFDSAFCDEILIPEKRESSRRRRGTGSTSTQGRVIAEAVRFNSEELCELGSAGYVIKVAEVIQGTIIVNIVFAALFGCCFCCSGTGMVGALCGCRQSTIPAATSPDKYDPTPNGANNYGDYYNKESVGTSAYGTTPAYQPQALTADSLVVVQGTAI